MKHVRFSQVMNLAMGMWLCEMWLYLLGFNVPYLRSGETDNTALYYACQSYHSLVMCTYLLHMVLRDLISPAEDVDDAAKQLESDLKILQGIKTTWYLQGHTQVIKSGQLHLT